MLLKFISLPITRTVLLFSLIMLVFGFFAALLAPLLIPIIISFALYAMLEPISGALERQGMSSTSSSLTVLLVLLAFSALAISLLMPHLSTQLAELQTQLPSVWKTLIGFAKETSQFFASSMKLDAETSNSMTQPLFDKANELSKDILITGSNLIIEFSVLVILVPIFTFFLIRDYRGFRNYLLDALPNNSFELGWIIYHRVTHQLQEYIRGIMIQSGIMSVITSLGFFIIGLDSYILLGIIAGILNLIPYVGPLLAMVLPILLALAHTPLEPWIVGAAVGVIAMAQIIDNVIVVPAVIANAVNLHPVIVIVGIIIFGNLFGFIGMIVAIPAISTANIIFRGLLQGLRTRKIEIADQEIEQPIIS
ncbi:MAG: AI-2E family transporter [Gammaproteobacteria bacterium]|nr:AI-2E family transporter [Gammaproteobacteria bacterium]